MADFLGFGQVLRPDIGLLADGIQNLAEIYTSDQPLALRNIGLDPDVLDTIYELSEKISREDLRAASGLSSLLLPTLDLSRETFERINTRVYINEIYAGTASKIGIDPDNQSLAGDMTKTDNVIIYNGSIQCQGVQYRTKKVSQSSLFAAENVLTSVSTSRASLFNSERFATGDNAGYFKAAYYSSSIRVRRRSHINTLTINKSTFIPKPTGVSEKPSHEIKCYISTVSGSGVETSNTVQLLATKNSPLRIPCRMGAGARIVFQFNGVQTVSNCIFGYQVQPLQSKTVGQTASFIPLSPISYPIAQQSSFPLDIDITASGYQDNYDLYLYLYLDPTKITGLEFINIRMTEFVDGKDIGLLGFDNLESLRLQGSNIKILPLWLKTLSGKLKTLDIATDGDTYRNGIMRYFDYRNASEVASLQTPLYTMASYLTIPVKGAMISEDPSLWSNVKFEKYVKSQIPTGSMTPGMTRDPLAGDFRVFSNLENLLIADRALGKNPRLDDIFPNLTRLYWVGFADRAIWPIQGTPPKINNNGKKIIYDISLSGASGSIFDIGTSTTITDNGHLSKYAFDQFYVNGYEFKLGQLSGSIATSSPSSEWNAWFSNTKTINIAWSPNLSIGLQDQTWQQLQSLTMNHSGGVAFKVPGSGTAADPLLTPKLTSLNIYGSASTGRVPSLGGVTNTNELTSIQLGGNITLGTVPENGFNYVLPSDFAPDRGGTSEHKLTVFSINDVDAGYRAARFRSTDFKYLYNLEQVNLARYREVWGRFPAIPPKKITTNRKNVYIDINDGCKFYDISALDITDSNALIARDFIRLSGWNMNSGRGGCKSPSFSGISSGQSPKISHIDFSNSLPSQYPVGWNGTIMQGGSYIFDSDPPSVVDGLTPTTVLNTDDPIYYLSKTDGALTSKVLVNDAICDTAGGPEIARVLSVTTTRIYIDREIVSASPITLYFYRRVQPIDSWFALGFGELSQLRLRNSRLGGSLNIKSGFSKIVNDSYPCLDLSSNCLTGYVKSPTSGFRRIFTGGNRAMTIDLSYNNFSVGVMTDMLRELLDIANASTNIWTNVTIRLNNTKLSQTTGNNSYVNYSQSELFPTTTQSQPNQSTSLTRTELVYVTDLVTTTDADGQTTTTAVRTTKTKNIVVPGAYIADPGGGLSAGYYQTKTTGSQKIVESQLGQDYRKATTQGRRWNISLGFTYTAPSTASTVTGTTYSNPTTRLGSLGTVANYTLGGTTVYYTESDLVNP